MTAIDAYSRAECYCALATFHYGLMPLRKEPLLRHSY